MITGKYNQSKTVKFSLVAPDGVDLIVNATFAAGDIKISKDEGAEVNTTNLPTDEGTGYSLVLTATEMSAARISLYIIDQTATKIWLDIPIEIETYGNASAEHAFDLDTAAAVMRGTDNAATETKQDIIDTNIDTLLTRIVGTLAAGTHNPATVAQIAVLSDWINGGRLDLILDIIAADVVNIDGAAMRGTDNAATAANLAIIDTVVDAIKAVTDLLPDAGALTTLITHLTDIKGATFSGLTDSLEAIRDRGDIAWLTGAGGSAPTVVQIRQEMDANSTQFALIVADTNELQTDWVNGGRLDLILDIIAADTTTDIPALIAALNNLSAAQVNTEVDTALVDFFTSVAFVVDAVWNEVLTGATHNVIDSAGRRVRDLQEFGSYEGGAIFIDTINGAPGTTDYESGTILNPVNTIADANTLAASLNLPRFEVAPGSSIAFAVSQIGQVFKGVGWILALGGQNISNSEIIGAQVVTGIALTPTGEVHFIDCEVVSGTLGQAHLKFCGLGGTLTLSAAANYTLSNCYSQIPGSPTPIIDFGAAVGNTGLSMRSYSGGIEIQNYGVTGIDTMSLEGNGQLVINANCAGGTIYVRGNFKVTDNSGGAVTIVYDDNTANAIAILEDTSATIPAQIGALNDPTAAAVAAAVASFDMGNGRTIEEALSFLRNKWTIIGGILTVYGTDDVTVLWTAPVTTTAGNPVSGIDPV